MKKFLRASYTVESSVIAALLLFLVFFLLYVSFLSFDRVHISYTLKEALLWSREEWMKGNYPDEEMICQKAADLQGRMLVLSDPVYTTEISGIHYTITCESNSVIWQSIMPLLPRVARIQQEQQMAEVNIMRPEHYIRMFKFVKEGAKQWMSDIKGS